ncbi:MAG: GNAT family N-acetyltransferase [Chitinophagaceae bacterium]|nr:GNAT family N-acetyltransferase [Chitinophagaceae bacterium]
MSEINLQPVLEDDIILAEPLKKEDFERLYKVASDPEVWANHPNKNRYKRDVFTTFFEGAMQSGGAFLVTDKQTGEVIGSSRFYDWNPEDKSLLIGYTFFAKDHWGQGFNHRLKRLMLNHAFQFADKVIFHIGAVNIPSQKSIVKLGAIKTGELEVKYFGEEPKLNYVYEITRDEFLKGAEKK